MAQVKRHVRTKTSLRSGRGTTLTTPQGHVLATAQTLLLLLPPLLDAHPQCLNSGPPFPPSSPITMCKQYSDFTCCSPHHEAELVETVHAVKHGLTPADWDKCQNYVVDLLCQQCSPLAAHMFDAELSSWDAPPRVLPGLCTSYCSRFYDQCRDIVWFVDPDLAASIVFQNKTAFCEQAAISDMGYCYPDFVFKCDSAQPAEQASAVSNDSAEESCLCLERVVSGLANPIFARHAGDGSGRLFVGEQLGIVHVVYPADKRKLPAPFLDISHKVYLPGYLGDERGMGGLAFHPNFSRNGRVFVWYNAALSLAERTALRGQLGLKVWDHKSRLSEFRVLPAHPDAVDPGFEKVLLEVNHPYPNHNGGELFFLDDGYLYVFLGDGGSAGDPNNIAQNKSQLLGKVLRLDVDTPSDDPDLGYNIPPDNPFVHSQDAGGAARSEVFAYGVRNIWRCGVDPGDRSTGSGRGRVLCGDVGQALYEEVDLLKKGANYGWRAREGYDCYDQNMCDHIGEEELPVYVYNHTVGQSVTGGQFYRGCRSPSLNGKYIYGDYQSIEQRLFTLEETSPGTWVNSDVTMCPEACVAPLTNVVDKHILSFGQDQQGEVYVLTSNSSWSKREDGAVYIIVDPASVTTDAQC